MVFDLKYAKEVIINESEAINRMSAIVDDSFEKACELIFSCKGSVILSGIGKAGIIGQKISATLASTGSPSHFLHPAEAVHGDLGRLRAEDVVIILSFGGETDEVSRMINLVKKQGVRMIGITGKKNSTLAKYSDVLLCMGQVNEACPLGVAPSVSTTCMLAIGDSLALTVMKARNFGVEDYVKFHPGGSLGAKLMTVEQSMMFKPGEKLPIVDKDMTIEKMLEATKEVKRHGAVIAVNSNGELAGIVTDADLRRHIADKGAESFDSKVNEIMTEDCKRIKADALAAEATALFHKHRIDELPVVDSDGKPIGMIDVQDILTIKVVG